MKQLAGLCFLAAVILGALEHLDRTSAMALTVVEWSQRLGVPLFAIATILGVAALVFDLLGRSQSKTSQRPRAGRQPSSSHSPGRTARAPLHDAATLPPVDSIDPDKTVSSRSSDWREEVRALAQSLELGKGARITIDLSTTSPITLHLEHLSPAHCKRAIAGVGSLISVIPVPPRLKVIFDHCPQAGVPRHHQVAGALAQILPRGHFRVVSHVDAVDVMFLHPDPAWGAPVRNN